MLAILADSSVYDADKQLSTPEFRQDKARHPDGSRLRRTVGSRANI
jgi:hypothetical protein